MREVSLRMVGYRIVRPEPHMNGHGDLIRNQSETAWLAGEVDVEPVYIKEGDEE